MGLVPPDQKYIHTYKHTNKQTNKHRERQTAVWLRPYVFNIGQKTTTKSALQSLIGKLVFISKYVRQSRVFISRILYLLRKLKFHHHHVHLNAEFRKDIRWWCRFRRSYNGVSMINTASRLLPGEVFTSDACLSGCGGLCVDQYFHSVFPDFILSQHLDINCLELLTIIVALRLWGTRWKGPRLTVRCDNAVAATVLNTGRCRNPFLNSCLREICYLSALFEFQVRAVHLPGESNCVTDTLSRWYDNTPAKEQFLAHALRNNLTDQKWMSQWLCLNWITLTNLVFVLS